MKQPPVVKPILPVAPFERLVIDLVNLKEYARWNDGFKYILTAIDSFTAFAFTFSLKSKRAIEVARKLILLFSQYSPPKKLQSDNGSEFIADVIKIVCGKLNVKIIHGAPYKPSTQGKVERFNQTLEREIGKYLTGQQVKRWVDILECITRSYNLTYHTTIKMILFKALFGWAPWSRRAVTLEEVGK